MKILLLNANRAEKGTYYRALHFGRELARYGHIITMMTVSNTSRFRALTRLDSSGMRIIECPNFLDEFLPWHASGILDICLRIWEISTNKYDCVYAFEYQPNVSFPVLLTKPFKAFKLISDWCDWHAGASYHFGGKKWAHAIDKVFEEYIRHRADFVTTINTTLRDRALTIGLLPERLCIVREGVDTDFISPMDKYMCRKELGIPLDTKIVATIIDSSAAVHLLLQSIEAVSRVLPTVSLLVIGSIAEGLQTSIRASSVASRTIFPGRVSDAELPRYLACADVLVLPLEDNLTNRGRWPHKLGDMLAAQRPTLVTPAGEFPTIAHDFGCVKLIPFESTGISKTILEVLLNPDDFERMAIRARHFALTELNWQQIGHQLDTILKHVVNSK